MDGSEKKRKRADSFGGYTSDRMTPEWQIVLCVALTPLLTFNSIDIASDDGWEMLEKTIAAICAGCFGQRIDKEI